MRLARWLIDAGETIPVVLMLQAGRPANLAGDPGFGAELATQALEAGGGIEAALLLARAHTIQSQFTEAESVLTAAENTIETQEAGLDYLEQQSEVLHWRDDPILSDRRRYKAAVGEGDRQRLAPRAKSRHPYARPVVIELAATASLVRRRRLARLFKRRASE